MFDDLLELQLKLMQMQKEQEEEERYEEHDKYSVMLYSTASRSVICLRKRDKVRPYL